MKNKWTGERLETGIYGQVSIEHLHRYALACEFAKGADVLDIACGEGYGSNLLAAHAASVLGVDIDNEVIAQANKKYERPNLSFQPGDARALNIGSAMFHLVVSFETLEHTAEHDAVLSELKRVLKNEGLLIISTPEKQAYNSPGSEPNPFHAKELDRNEFEILLGKYFRHITLLDQFYVSGSVLLPETVKDRIFYGGNFQEISRSGDARAKYLVALASDVPLKAGASLSFFSEGHMLDLALRQQEAAIRKTPTYRTGKLILSPFKWIKKLFG